MKLYVVHISDASLADYEAPFAIDNDASIPLAAKAALDEFLNRHGTELRLPIFIDIHAASHFTDTRWMHSKNTQQ